MSVEFGQAISVWCIRASLVAFFAFALFRIRAMQQPPPRILQRLLSTTWLAATALYWVHFLTAMGYFHGWSHVAAVEHTAMRTAEATGLSWGGGIYFNHLFTLLITIEAAFWQLRPSWCLARARWVSQLIYGYCLFIAFNAAVVFASGTTRWASAAAFFALIGFAFWIRRRMTKRQTAD